MMCENLFITPGSILNGVTAPLSAACMNVGTTPLSESYLSVLRQSKGMIDARECQLSHGQSVA